MKTRHCFWGAALFAAIILTVIGALKGARVWIGIATTIELLVSIATGKSDNV